MTVKVISVYTRPGQDVPWHEPITLNKKLTKKYGNKRVMIVSNTETVLTVNTVWNSLSDKEAFDAEPDIIQQINAIREYHESVGIIAEPKVVIEEI